VEGLKLGKADCEMGIVSKDRGAISRSSQILYSCLLASVGRARRYRGFTLLPTDGDSSAADNVLAWSG
jgi:hypothetical protein